MTLFVDFGEDIAADLFVDTAESWHFADIFSTDEFDDGAFFEFSDAVENAVGDVAQDREFAGVEVEKVHAVKIDCHLHEVLHFE